MAVTVDSAGQAVGLLRGRNSAGLRVLDRADRRGYQRARTGFRSASTASPSRCRCPCTARSGPARCGSGCRGTVPACRRPRPRSAGPPAAARVVAARSRRPAATAVRWATRRSPRAIRTDPGRHPMPAGYEQFTRASRRAGAGQGAVGADADFRRRAPGRLVGQRPGVTRPGSRGSRRRARASFLMCGCWSSPRTPPAAPRRSRRCLACR